MMLHGDLRRDANLSWAAAHQFRQTGRRHGAGDAHFPLTAHFCTRNRGVHFVERANDAGGQEVTAIGIRVHRANKLVVIGQYRRDDAAGTVGWGGHHAATGGVFFIHGEGEHINPINDVHRIDVVLVAGHQNTAQSSSAALNLHWAGQQAFGIHAAFNTGTHHLPDFGEVRVDCCATPARFASPDRTAKDRRPCSAVVSHAPN